MHVVMAASEAVPFVKTGGLGDVVGALPAALQRLGIEVSIVLPAYHGLSLDRASLRRTDWQLRVPVSDRIVTAGVLATQMPGGVPVYLIEADQYFARTGLYGTPDGDFLDNAERFAFFSRAIPALLPYLGTVDVLHCHDWQTALALVFLRADAGRYPELSAVRGILTIHNVGYQGVFWHLDWHLLNLDWQFFTPSWLEFHGKINYLKGGIVSADAVTTVSPTYAREIQTPEFGCGLEGVLADRQEALVGILNGVDYAEWSPEHDRHIAAPYSVDDLRGKAVCKADLQAAVGLPVHADQPLIGIVSRLAAQKGFDLLSEIAPQLLHKHLQLVVLGSGDASYQELFTDLAHQHRKRLALRIAFDNALAHKIEAGSDLFLMPSRYEPCGLNQIYSLRYGTIPVVRSTGGLADTIADYDPATGNGTGFSFAEYSGTVLMACIDRALATYRTPEVWRRLIRNAMRADFSWNRSAQAYVALYRRVIGGR
ncbi:MAG: glycogen/starch synthase, ADP-glucose type [Deltaproteobacteria bacterium]|nr:glycogen/starch synthase, ADP-glucose type [Deltaproteobacteria bacterium]